jgi:hypothetical protein
MEVDEELKVVQAYTDYLLIFSDSKEKMNGHMEAITALMNFARISFNTEKCKLIVNNPINEIL